MALAIEHAADRLAGEVEFDFLLGGINVQATHPIGDFGRRHLDKVWRDVHATTGQVFGFVLPEHMVYNSLVPCKAIHAVRGFLGKPPFGYLHALQQCLFVQGRNVTDLGVLIAVAADFGCPPDVVVRGVEDPAIHRVVMEEFDSARRYGTNALPALLVERNQQRSLLAGGYADADMLVELIRAQSVHAEISPRTAPSDDAG
jgi:protein-disulfide isomerase-like protein with CxxC motif